MPDSDVSLEILIRTLAETAGAEKVQEALNKVKDSAEKSGEAHGGAAKEVEKHAGAHRALHKVMHAINELVPGLGSTMQFYFGAMAGGAAVAVMGIQALAGWLERIKERYKEAAEQSAAVWEGQRKTLETAKEAAQDYADTQKRIKESVDELKASEDKELGTLQAIEEARKKILEAQEAAEMAAAKGNPIAEAQVQARYRRKKSDEELGAEADTLAQKEAFLTAEKKKATEAQEAYNKAVAAKEAGPDQDLRDQASRASTWLTQHADDLKKAQARADRAGNAQQLRDEADLYGSQPSYVVNPSGGMSITAAGAARKRADEAEEAEKALSIAKMSRQFMEGTVSAFNDALKALDKAVEETKARHEAADKQVTQRENELSGDRSVYGIHAQTAAALKGEETIRALRQAGFKPDSRLGQFLLQTIEAEEARARGDQESGISTGSMLGEAAQMRKAGMSPDQIRATMARMMEARSHGEQMSQDQAVAIHKLTAALKAAGNNQARINQIIEDMLNINLSHEAKLNELAAALHLQRQNQATRTLPGGG